MDKKNDLIYTDYDALYRELFTPLFRYLLFRTKNYDIANDLTQTTFLKFLKQKDKPENKEYAIRQIYTIAKNTLIDYWRVENKKRYESDVEMENIKDESLNQEERAIINEDIKFVKEMLADMDEQEQEIITMRLTLDMDYKNIAEKLGIQIENARKIYSRALQKIKVEIIKSKKF